MAKEKISEIFDIEAILRQVKIVEDKIEGVAKKMEEMADRIVACNSDIASSSGYEQLGKAVKELTGLQKIHAIQEKEMSSLVEQRAKLNIKLSDTYKERLLEVEKIKQKVSEESKAIRDAAKASVEKDSADKASTQSINDVINQLKRQRDSVSELMAENKRLRDLAKSMDYNTQKSEIEKINTVIDDYTALVELNSDAYVRQKMNIGNYKSAVEGLDTVMKSLEAEMKRVADTGGKDSEEFKKLYAEFQKAQKLASEYNEKITQMSTESNSLKKELREVKEQMQQMELAGKGNTELYEKLSTRAVELTQAINGVNDQIKNMEAPTATFDSIMGGLSGLSGGFEVFQGVMGFCNLESKEFAKIQAKVQSAIAITNGLTAVATALDKDQAFMIGLKTWAQSKNIVVSKTATVVQKALNAAMNKFPLLLLVSAIVAGVAALGKWIMTSREATKEQKAQSEIMTKASDKYAEQSLLVSQMYDRVKKGRTLRSDEIEIMKILTETYGENYTKGKNTLELEKKFIEIAPEYIKILKDKAMAQAAFELAVEKEKEALREAGKPLSDYINTWDRLFSGSKTAENRAKKSQSTRVKNIRKEGEVYLRVNENIIRSSENREKSIGKLSDSQIKAEQKRLAKLEEYKKKELKAFQDREKLKYQVIIDASQNIIDNEKSTFNERIEAQFEYEEAHKNLLKKQAQFDMKGLSVNSQQFKLIQEKLKADLLKIENDGVKTREVLEKDEAIKRIARLNNISDKEKNRLELQCNEELNILSKKYKNSKMTSEQYEKEKLEISRKYNKKAFEEDINNLEKIVKSFGLTGEDLKAVQKQLAEKKVEYAKWANEQIISDDEEAAVKRKEIEKQLQESRTQLFQEAFSTMTSLVNSFYERRIQNIDAEIEKIEEQKNLEIEALTQSGATKDEIEQGKMAIEAKAQAQKDKLEKEKKKEQRKQAIAEKAAALMKIAIDTAVAVAKINAQAAIMAASIYTAFYAPIAYAQIPFVLASGALQAATIAARPIPKYAQGTEDHPGGLAIVGDGGKKELIKTREGDYFITPDTPILIDMPKHAEVLPDISKILDSSTLHPVVFDNEPAYDFYRLEEKIEQLEKSFVNVIQQNRSSINIGLDKDGIWTSYERSKGQTKYLNERLNIRR